MNRAENLTESFNALASQYLANSVSLNSLVHRTEALLEQCKSRLTPDKYLSGMNCVYIIEEINALVLDEGRPLRVDERLNVVAELQKLSTLVAGR